MIRATLSIFLLLFVAPHVFAEETRQFKKSDFPKLVVFAGVEHHLAFEEEAAGQFLIEYVPSGETLEKWSTMFAVRLQRMGFGPKAMARRVHVNLQKQNVPSKVFFPEDKGEAWLEFVTGTPDNSIVEYNVWKCLPAQNGVLSYQFAKRFYSDTHSKQDMQAYFQDVKSKNFNELKDYPLPPFQ